MDFPAFEKNVLILLAIIASLIIIAPRSAYAATASWPFTNSGDYTVSDANKVEVTGGVARLKNQGVVPITPTANTVGLFRFNATSGAEANNEGVEISNSDTGLVGMFHMNSAIASVANGASIPDNQLNIAANNGTASNVNGTGMAYVAGKFGNALSLEGTDDYVTVANGFTNTIKADDTHTIELWVYPRSISNQPLLYDAFQLGGYDYFLEVGNSTTNMMYWGIGGGTTNYRSYKGAVLAINQWHHIVAVKTAAGNNGDLYINGVLQENFTNTGTGLGNTPNANSDMYFGRYRGASSYYLNGNLDEVAIYTTAFTREQVLEHYHRGRTVDSEGKGPITGTLTVGGSGSQTTVSSAWSNATGGNAKLGNQALSLDGTDDYVSVADNANLKPSQISVAFWVKFNSLTSADTILGKTTSSAWNNGYAVDLYNASSRFRFWVNNYATGGIAQSTTIPTTGQWYHVVGTYDLATVKLYINGTLEATTNYSTTITHSSSAFEIGRLADNAYNTNSSIDEVAVYNIALSAAEVTRQYNATAGLELTGKEPGLVTLWHFNDGGSNTTVADSKGDHGIILGPVSIASTTGLDQALNFDGVDDYVSIPDNNLLDITANITLEAWIKPSALQNYMTIVSKRTTGVNNYEIRTGTGASNDEMEFAYYDGAAWHVYTSTNANLATATWYHVAATFTFATGASIVLYKNGQSLTGSWTLGTGNVATVANTAPLVIGSTGHSPPIEFFNGYIDEVVVWSSALSAATIAQHARTTNYPTDNPTVVNNAGQAYTSLSSYAATLGGGNAGVVQYQISNNGSNWYYHNGSNWVAATGYAQTTTASAVNTNISGFITDVGSGTFFFKAFLNSDGTQAVELDQIDVGYNTVSGPKRGAVMIVD